MRCDEVSSSSLVKYSSISWLPGAAVSISRS
jgi:hypothetical protein